MENRIILISGGTGVGTSTYARELANELKILSVTSTDLIRQALRSFIAAGINPALEKSTYLAGQTKNYAAKPDNEKRSEIMRAYKTQCSAVGVGLYGIIRRGIEENTDMIVEGVHLIPGKIRESGVYKKYKNRFLEFLISIDDSEIHRNRFIGRAEEAPERKVDKYITNFMEIRWIHDYLMSRTKRYRNIHVVDNSDNIQTGLEQIMSHLSQ